MSPTPLKLCKAKRINSTLLYKYILISSGRRSIRCIWKRNHPKQRLINFKKISSTIENFSMEWNNLQSKSILSDLWIEPYDYHSFRDIPGNNSNLSPHARQKPDLLHGRRDINSENAPSFNHTGPPLNCADYLVCSSSWHANHRHEYKSETNFQWSSKGGDEVPHPPGVSCFIT